jgi:predicted Zn-dependent peptidase
MPHVRSATVGIWADVGSACEHSRQRGISHVLEHMLFKGTPRRSAREIAEAIDGVGGSSNAFTDKESTCYYARVIDRHVPLALDVLSDMFLHSSLDPEELSREQRVILEEIRMYEDSPNESIHDLFTRTMWAGSNLGEPTIGSAETVTAMTAGDLRVHLGAHYAADSVVIAAAGNLEHDDFVARCAQAFASFGGKSESTMPETPILTPSVRIQYKDTEQAHVMIGARGLASKDERRYVLALIDTIFGGGMSSRLFQEVREKRGLAYSVYSAQQSYRGAGLFAVSLGTSPQNVQECIDISLEQVRLLTEHGPTDAEIRLAKEHLKGGLTLSLESTSSRMIRLGQQELTFGRQLTPEEIEAAIDRVEREEIVALAGELFGGDRFGLCIIGPVDAAQVRWLDGVAVG